MKVEKRRASLFDDEIELLEINSLSDLIAISAMEVCNIIIEGYNKETDTLSIMIYDDYIE